MRITEIKTNATLDKNVEMELVTNGFSVVRKKNFLGGEPEISIIGAISISVITSITKIIVEIIRAKNKIEIEIDGKKIKNINEKTISKILEKGKNDD